MLGKLEIKSSSALAQATEVQIVVNNPSMLFPFYDLKSQHGTQSVLTVTYYKNIRNYH